MLRTARLIDEEGSIVGLCSMGGALGSFCFGLDGPCFSAHLMVLMLVNRLPTPLCHLPQQLVLQVGSRIRSKNELLRSRAA